MDEIDWMKHFRKCLKYFNIFVFGFSIITIIRSFIGYLNDKDIVFLFDYIIGMSLLLLITNIFSILIYGIIWLRYKITYVKFDVDFNKEYMSELKDYYPPAIVSLIYDLKTEVYRDYTATILKLYIKKYIKISGFQNNIVINKDENENISTLLKHEVYVYNCMIKKENLDENLFKKLILEDAKEKELIKEREKNIAKQKTLIIGLITLIISIILLNISENILWKIFIGMIMSIIIAMCWAKLYIFPILEINEEEYKLTTNGKKELKKIKAFKNFIKDYTLIEEKGIEHIQILEEYIPYSLSLGTSPQVEQYIKENEVYRNLIYKGREN